jgi:hypothetical protein
MRKNPFLLHLPGFIELFNSYDLTVVLQLLMQVQGTREIEQGR